MAFKHLQAIVIAPSSDTFADTKPAPQHEHGSTGQQVNACYSTCSQAFEFCVFQIISLLHFRA